MEDTCEATLKKLVADVKSGLRSLREGTRHAPTAQDREMSLALLKYRNISKKLYRLAIALLMTSGQPLELLPELQRELDKIDAEQAAKPSRRGWHKRNVIEDIMEDFAFEIRTDYAILGLVVKDMVSNFQDLQESQCHE